jgi:hypothetical protein
MGGVTGSSNLTRGGTYSNTERVSFKRPNTNGLKALYITTEDAIETAAELDLSS